MKKQFIRLNHKNRTQSSILAFDLHQRMYEELPLSHWIHVIKEEKKICVGYYDLKERKGHYCKSFTDLSDTKYTRCRQCEILTGFRDCVRCNGLSCNTKEKNAIQYCNRDHVVYLAYFPGGVVKVGTSLFERKEKRILEQGAVAAVFVCRTKDGKIAREIEHNIGKNGIKTRVGQDYKLKNLIVDKTESEIKKVLMQTFDDLQLLLNNRFQRFMIEPEFYSQYSRFSKIREAVNDAQGQLTLDFFDQFSCKNEEYEICKDYRSIKGEVVSSVGSILVVRNMHNTVSAYDLSKMEGHIADFVGTGSESN